MFLVYFSGAVTIYSVGIELISIFIEYKNISQYNSYLFYFGTVVLLWYPVNFLDKEFRELVSDYNKEPKIKTKSEILVMIKKAYLQGYETHAGLIENKINKYPDFEDYFIKDRDQAVNTDGSIKY